MKVLDKVWMIVRNKEGEESVWYSPPGCSAPEAWAKFRSYESLNHSYLSKEDMMKQGYRAKRVSICI